MRCISPISVKDPRATRGSTRLTVPCAKCGACRASRRAEWSFRLKYEFKKAKTAWFITLTYLEEQMPRIRGRGNLNKNHIQLWLKKLRKSNNGRIRYYLVGEYGTKTGRPHYHIIIFNVDSDNIQNIQRCWENGKKVSRGLVHRGSVNDGSIHYTLKYHLNYEKDKYQHYGLNPEFATMSRRPGIGYDYVNEAGWWNKKNKYSYLINNGYKQKLPRYYKNKVFSEKEKEEIAIASIKLADIQYKKEVERLQKQGYNNPEYELEKRQFIKAKQQKSKANENAKL